MKELPNIGQNWLNFTRTLPGVTGNAEAVSVNGGQRFWGNWLSDGGLVVIPRSQNLDSPVIFESIAEVKITTSTFDAQYGSGTAVFNQVTKSDTKHSTEPSIYFNYDTTINRSANPGFSTRPTAAMKADNFSDPIFRTIYDPASLQTINGQQVRQPFPGNCIPLSAMSL